MVCQVDCYSRIRDTDNIRLKQCRDSCVSNSQAVNLDLWQRMSFEMVKYYSHTGQMQTGSSQRPIGIGSKSSGVGVNEPDKHGWNVRHKPHLNRGG